MSDLLTTPIKDEEIAALKAGDTIYITGTMVTARDAAHKKALDLKSSGKEMPIVLEGLPVFHCGPIVKDQKVVAAGPTTSTRMESLEADFIREFGVKVIIGKGGMGDKTLKALQDYTCVYCSFTGGAGVLGAKGIKSIEKVIWLDDLGAPEALWVFNVERFGPLTVAMDSHGKSIYKEVAERAEKRLGEYFNL